MRKGLSGENNGRFKTGITMLGDPRRHIYNSWQNMKARCLRTSHPKYHRYGGRGITVCEAWLDIGGFLLWAESAGMKAGMTVDRINNDGDYEPSNCRVISLSENSRKKRTTKITFEQAQEIRCRLQAGEREQDLAKEYGVVHGTVWFIANNFTHVAEGECTKKLKQRLANG